jgi:hypothetical protein
MIDLLDSMCDIWHVHEADPEIENDEDRDEVMWSNVLCRKDTIMNRRSNEANVPGGTLTTARATFFMMDDRLQYPATFDEQMWIMHNSLRWNITAIHEARDSMGLHHYEVDTVSGVVR